MLFWLLFAHSGISHCECRTYLDFDRNNCWLHLCEGGNLQTFWAFQSRVNFLIMFTISFRMIKLCSCSKLIHQVVVVVWFYSFSWWQIIWSYKAWCRCVCSHSVCCLCMSLSLFNFARSLPTCLHYYIEYRCTFYTILWLASYCTIQPLPDLCC